MHALHRPARGGAVEGGAGVEELQLRCDGVGTGVPGDAAQGTAVVGDDVGRGGRQGAQLGQGALLVGVWQAGAREAQGG